MSEEVGVHVTLCHIMVTRKILFDMTGLSQMAQNNACTQAPS